MQENISIYHSHFYDQADLDVSAELHSANCSIHEGRLPHQIPEILYLGQQTYPIDRSLFLSQQLQASQEVPILSNRYYHEHFTEKLISRHRELSRQLSSKINNANANADTLPTTSIKYQLPFCSNVTLHHQGSSGYGSALHHIYARDSDTTPYTHTLRYNLRKAIVALQDVMDRTYPFTVAEFTSVFTQIRNLIREETAYIDQSFAASMHLTTQALQDAGLNLQLELSRDKDELSESIHPLGPYIGEVRENSDHIKDSIGLEALLLKRSLADCGSNLHISRYAQNQSSAFQSETLYALYRRRMLVLSQLKNLRHNVDTVLDPNSNENLSWLALRKEDIPAYAFATSTAFFLTRITHEFREWEALRDAYVIEYEQVTALGNKLKLLHELWVPGKRIHEASFGPDNGISPVRPSTSNANIAGNLWSEHKADEQTFSM